jgi:hypothetical protein
MPVIQIPPPSPKPHIIVRIVKWPFQKLWDKFGPRC